MHRCSEPSVFINNTFGNINIQSMCIALNIWTDFYFITLLNCVELDVDFVRFPKCSIGPKNQYHSFSFPCFIIYLNFNIVVII